VTALPPQELDVPRRQPRERLDARVRRAACDPVDVHIGARIKLRRRVLGLSQSDLARELDVTYQQVCKYEAGDNRISAAKLFHASDVLSCPISFFFEGLGRVTTDETRQRSDGAERILSQFLARPDALRLAGEFPKIRSRRLRRHLMSLVSCLAEEGRGAG
jgi:transcriptional regulator with XRE-family HTH domain